jgi:hypothetical protein
VLNDFPLGLDVSSLRFEGEADAKLTIGAIDARTPRATAPADLPELDKRLEALSDECANLQGAIDAATAPEICRAFRRGLAGWNSRQG